MHRIAITTIANNGVFARDNDYIYIFSSYNDNDKRQKSSLFDLFSFSKTIEYHTLLRIQAKSFFLGDFTLLETLVNTDKETNSSVWENVVSVLDRTKPLPIFPHLLTEPNFFYDFKKHLFTIVSLEIFDSSIKICRSKLIEGPYLCTSTSKIRADVDDSFSRNYMSYAAKAHPELSGDSNEGLVLSYIINTIHGPAELFKEDNVVRELYQPLFVYANDFASVTKN